MGNWFWEQNESFMPLWIWEVWRFVYYFIVNCLSQMQVDGTFNKELLGNYVS